MTASIHDGIASGGRTVRRAGTRILGVIVVAGLLVGACGRPVHPWEYRPRTLADTLPIHEPEGMGTSLLYENMHGAFTGMGRAVDLTRRAGLPPALNADPFDEIIDSAWFTKAGAYRVVGVRY